MGRRLVAESGEVVWACLRIEGECGRAQAAVPPPRKTPTPSGPPFSLRTTAAGLLLGAGRVAEVKKQSPYSPQQHRVSKQAVCVGAGGGGRDDGR